MTDAPDLNKLVTIMTDDILSLYHTQHTEVPDEFKVILPPGLYLESYNKSETKEFTVLTFKFDKSENKVTCSVDIGNLEATADFSVWGFLITTVIKKVTGALETILSQI